MQWKLMAATFGIVFLAEVGDKTQLAALVLTGKSGSPWTVFAGASLALILATAIGVAAGAALNRFLPPKALDVGAAVLFIGVGVFLLVRAIGFRGAGA